MKLADFKTYKITEKELKRLRKKGWEEGILQNLAKLEEQLFDSQEAFRERLLKFENGQAILAQEKTLFSMTGGYFRLDRAIPNKTLREWVEALIFAVVVAVIVRFFLFAPFKIPSSSMVPTIQVGDHIFASMYSYGLPIPFSNQKLWPQPIKRGDIVIFPYPKNPRIDYIKRVVALEGETIEIKDDVVYIDGKKLDEPYTYFDPQANIEQELAMLQTGVNQYSTIHNFGPVLVPKGKLFVMGDNRYRSSDGRFWGFVDQDTVKGKAQIVYFSWNTDNGIISGLQLGRILNWVE